MKWFADWFYQNELQEAQSPNTPAKRLLELSSLPFEEIKRTIAKNPNAPLDTLFDLGRDYPEDLLQNPILMLLSLENPHYFSRINPGLLHIWLRASYIPDFLLTSAVNHHSSLVRRAIAAHPSTHIPLLEKLSTDTENSVKEEVAKNPNTPQKILENFLTDQHANIRKAAQQNPRKPEYLVKLLQRAGATEDLSGFQIETQDPTLQEDEFMTLLGKGFWSRLLIARHPKTPLHILTTLSNDVAWEVRKAIAEHGKIPYCAQKTLLKDRHLWVLQALATNPVLAKSIFEAFSYRENQTIRKSLLANPNCPAHIVKEIKHLNDFFVQTNETKQSQ